MMESARIYPYKPFGLERPLAISGFECAGETGVPSQLSASRPGRNSSNVLIRCRFESARPRLQQPPFPYISAVFGTARSCQGRAGFARRSEPLTARTVLEHRFQGKGGARSHTFPDPLQSAVAGAEPRYRSLVVKTAHAIRRSLLARATITTFWWARASS